MNSDGIAFIIIAYHPKAEEFIALLKSLPAEQTIVVDNGQTLHPDDVGKATLLSPSNNIGYGAAANIGIRHAIAHAAEWFVILNQDLDVSRVAVRELTDQLMKLSPCIAGPVGGGLDPKRWTTMLPSGRADYVSGSCMAIHRKVVEKIGYFYESYFLYYEEVDYCVCASRAGFPILQLHVPEIVHEDTKTLGRGSMLHQYYLARNHMLFVQRQAPSDVKLHEVLRFPKTISEHIKYHEKGALIGIRDYLIRRFGPYGGRI